jgi:hypothetical protein
MAATNIGNLLPMPASPGDTISSNDNRVTGTESRKTYAFCVRKALIESIKALPLHFSVTDDQPPA